MFFSCQENAKNSPKNKHNPHWIYKGKNAVKCFISRALDAVESWAEGKKMKAGTRKKETPEREGQFLCAKIAEFCRKKHFII